MKSSFINQVRNAQENNTVNNNTSEVTNMTNIKSVEIVLNIVMTSGELKASSFAKSRSGNRPHQILGGRSCWFFENTQNGSVFGTFAPLPKKATCSSGRNNAPVVIFHMEDGSSKILDAYHTAKFWTRTVGVEDLDTERVYGKIDIPLSVMTAKQFEFELRATRFRALSIKFDRTTDLFVPQENPHGGVDRLVLNAKNAVVSPLRNTVGDVTQTLSFDTSNFFEESKPTAKLDLSKYSKSAKRRPARKAQAEAARASVDTAVEAPVEMNFGGSTVVSTAEETPAAPVVETPVAPQVDMATMIQQAVAAAIAPLTQEIASLRSELKAKDAEIEALKAAQAQPVAEPTPVVEEVTPEPVAEVEEAPAVEETVKETSKLSARERALLRHAERTGRTVRRAGSVEISADDFNFND